MIRIAMICRRVYNVVIFQYIYINIYDCEVRVYEPSRQIGAQLITTNLRNLLFALCVQSTYYV